jgi:hypothetical protein
VQLLLHIQELIIAFLSLPVMADLISIHTLNNLPDVVVPSVAVPPSLLLQQQDLICILNLFQ